MAPRAADAVTDDTTPAAEPAIPAPPSSCAPTPAAGGEPAPRADATGTEPPRSFAELEPARVHARIVQALVPEVQARARDIEAAIALLDGGATVPFIARYRKEATGGLDDGQLRTLEERLRYRRELEERRATVVRGIAQQGKLTEPLERALFEADTQARLEDLYAPYKPKRRTRAMIAREAGLEPLALLLLAEPGRDPATEAQAYVKADGEFTDVKSVLNGARDILTERFAEDADLVTKLRDVLRRQGWVQARVVDGKAEAAAKYADYFEHAERLATMPSHRALAVFRGRGEGVLRMELTLDEVPPENPFAAPPNVCEDAIAERAGIRDAQRPADKWLRDTVRWCWRTKLSVQLQMDLFAELRERAELEAIRVFAANLKDLLLAAPAGPRATMGLDPGLRTGVKVAVVDATGKLLATDTVYPHAPRNDRDGAIARLAKLAAAHAVDLVAIGNGTASRETEQLVRDLARRHPELHVTPVVVSEAGASVYSASELAATEFPALDVSLRGAVSIARRLQDPLAELVKIEPKAIGVGQYQHDVNAVQLARALDSVVEDCVNAVGVDVNTASAPLLSRVAGLNAGVAQAIVAHREQRGAFRRRAELREVPRLGERTFEQCAGFLRIMDGDDPLDASAVHPEAYGLVQRMLERIGAEARAVIGRREALAAIAPSEFVDERFGLPTIGDILRELEKPGRDPRPEFRTAKFADGVSEIAHLKPGMVLEGVVTNVTAFGAFIDVGVHQDGLAHVSELSDRFVKDPRDAVKAGQIVKARVLEVDEKRRRIALSLRTEGAPRERRAPPADARAGAPARRTGAGDGRREPPPRDGQRAPVGKSPAGPPANTALADALARARSRS